MNEQAVSHQKTRERVFQNSRTVWALVILLLLIHLGMQIHLSVTDSPVPDEVKQIPAGLKNWHAEYSLYRVTPPLVRYLANLPLLFSHEKVDWLDYPQRKYNRQETDIGRAFINSRGMEAFRWYRYGRWLNLGWTLLGALTCFLWARRLYGTTGGLLALLLWCFAPVILAHGHLITTDMAATSLGLLASYLFWIWLDSRRWSHVLLAGLLLGLAVLAKTTCIVFFVFWPLLVFLHWAVLKETGPLKNEMRTIAQLMVMAAVAVFCINLGYLFQGTFRSLGSYTFKSNFLAGEDPNSLGGNEGNRFSGTWVGMVPVPLPYHFVTGIDWQKADFESPRGSSYLLGEYRKKGWWWYYLYGIAIKTPLGMLGIWLLMFCISIQQRLSWRSKSISAASGRSGKNEWFLWGMVFLLMIFVSSQTGLSRHTRYVLPAIPFLYILSGKLSQWFHKKHKIVAPVTGLLLLALITESVFIFPYCISNFNLLIGGPQYANRHLTGSNIDWGQDMLRLKKWLDAHPEAKPIYYRGNHVRFDPAILGISDDAIPSLRESSRQPLKQGWYALSVNYTGPIHKSYRYLQDLTPEAMIGYSTIIYHVSEKQAQELREKYGFPVDGDPIDGNR